MFHDTACLRSCFAGSFVAVKRFFGTWLHACQPGVQCKVYNNYIQPVEINSCHTICQYMRHKKKENSNLIVKDPKYHCLNLRSLCFLTSGVRSVRHVFAIRPSKKKTVAPLPTSGTWQSATKFGLLPFGLGDGGPPWPTITAI